MSDEPVPGLTNPRALHLERYAIRTRESTSTQSAWRLAVGSAEGEGTILFIENSPGEVFYRGDGIFLGWDQERLAAAYAALKPKPEAERFETQQLG